MTQNGALKGREGIRLRVGDWRAIMHDGMVLAVLAAVFTIDGGSRWEAWSLSRWMNISL
jgi:hypothetical protein